MFYLLLERANVPEEVSSILEATGLKGEVAAGLASFCRQCCEGNAVEKN